MKYSGIGRHKSAIAKVFITEIQTETQTEIQTEIQTETQTETQTEIQTETQTETQTEIQTETQTETQIEMHTIIINSKTISDYFQNDKYAIDSIQQFLIFDGIDIPPLKIKIQVSGGGNTGQQKAICLALARTLYQMGMGFSEILKKKNLLTQDSRVKERRKYGLKKARKAPQYSKR